MEKYFESHRSETDGLFTDAIRTLRTAAVWGWEKVMKKGEVASAVEEGAPASAPVALASSRRSDGAKTMRELGIPGVLASELEFAFDLLGKVKDDQIVGFTFRTPEGTSYALRTEKQRPRKSLGRAA